MAAISLTGLAGACGAEVEFTRLNACEEVATIAEDLRAGRRPGGGGCRTARGPIEKQLQRAQGPTADFCFLQRPPGISIAQFQCVHSRFSDGGTLTCYRPVPVEVLAEYKEHYAERYADRVNQYLAETARCPASNGDATQAGTSLLPYALAPVSALDFGYVSQLGTSSGPAVGIVHGFARASPELIAEDVEALEFVAYWLAFKRPGVVPPRTRIGHWDLSIDDGIDFDTHVSKLSSNLGIAVAARSLDIDIRRAPLAPLSNMSQALSDALAKRASRNLVAEGFDELSDEEMERLWRMEPDDFLALMKAHLPFGFNDGPLKPRISQPAFLIKTRGASCTSRERGAFFAMVLHQDGTPGAESDFGNVNVLVMGVGRCGDRNPGALRYLAEVVEQVRREILEELAAY